MVAAPKGSLAAGSSGLPRSWDGVQARGSASCGWGWNIWEPWALHEAFLTLLCCSCPERGPCRSKDTYFSLSGFLFQVQIFPGVASVLCSCLTSSLGHALLCRWSPCSHQTLKQRVLVHAGGSGGFLV